MRQLDRTRPVCAPPAPLQAGAHVQALLVAHVLPDSQLDDDFPAGVVGSLGEGQSLAHPNAEKAWRPARALRPGDSTSWCVTHPEGFGEAV